MKPLKIAVAGASGRMGRMLIETVLKQVGDVIRAGEVVSTVGASGGNPESGLYFEMRYEGKALDPAKWLATR